MKRIKSVCSLFMITVMLLTSIQLPDFAAGEKYAIYEKYNYFDYTVVQKETQIFPEVFQYNLSANPVAYKDYYENYDNIVPKDTKDLTAWFAAIPAVNTGQNGDFPITYNSSIKYSIQNNPDYFVDMTVSISSIQKWTKGTADDGPSEYYTYTKSFTTVSYHIDRTKKRKASLVGTVVAQDGLYPIDGVANTPQGNFWFVKTSTPLKTPILINKASDVNYITNIGQNITVPLALNVTYWGTTYDVKYKVINSQGQQVVNDVILKSGTVLAPEITFDGIMNVYSLPADTYKIYVWATDSYNLVSNQLTYNLTIKNQSTSLGITNTATQHIATILPIKLNCTDPNPVNTHTIKYNIKTASGQLVSDSENVLTTGLSNLGVFPIDKTLDLTKLSNGVYLVTLWTTNGYTVRTNDVVYTVNIDKEFSIRPFVSSDLTISGSTAILSTHIKNNNINEISTAKCTLINMATGVVFSSGTLNSVVMTDGNRSDAVVLGSIPFASLPKGIYKVIYWAEAPNKKTNEESIILEYDTALQVMKAPIIKPPVMSSNGELKIEFTPLNTAFKTYKLVINDKEVNAAGQLVTTGEGHWFSLGNLDSYTLTGLNPNQTYTIKVKGRYSNLVESDFSALHTLRGIGNEPTALTGIKVIPSTKSALVSWKPVQGAKYYELKLFKEKNQLIGTFQTTEAQKLLENLTEDTFYYIEVKAVNGIGDGKPYKEFFRTEQPKIAERTVNTGASIVSNYEILVKWDVDPSAFGYDIEADGEIYTVGKSTEFKHASLAPGSRHVYRIRSKNQTENGPWSEPIVLMTTKGLVTDAFKNGKVTQSHNNIVLNWDNVPNASNYLISFNNGPFIDNGKNLYCIKSSLTPDTQYDFVVKAVNPIGASIITFTGSTRTKLLPVPVISNIEEVPAGIKITWQPVAGAEFYMLKQNETVVAEKLTETTFLVTNLKSLENMNFSLMAASAKGTSAWSSSITVEGMSEVPQKPQGLSACGSSNNIVVTWETLPFADVTAQGLAYEIEIDGVVWEPLELGKYTHDGLEPFSEHTYRVRVKNLSSLSEWTDKIVVQTLPGVPTPPKNVTIRNMTYYANLTWDVEPSVTGYEVATQQADGTFKTLFVGNRNFFNHKKLAPTEQIYKIRAINMIGASDWSQLIVNNAIKAECTRGKELDLGLTMSNITDFNQYELQVTYNPEAIDVTDLCGYTSEKELKAGVIVGTDIEVVSYLPGKIVFKVKKGLKNGTAWSGVINNIKFVPKQSGGSYINYTVFIGTIGETK